MNGYTILNALGGVEDNFLSFAEQSMKASPIAQANRLRRYILIAATLALILAAILLPIALGKDRTTTPEITTSTPTTTEKIYASITDIPGATKLESMDSINKDFTSTSRLDSDKWLETIKSNNSVFWGKLMDVEAVFIDDGDIRYVISVMTYHVYEGVLGFEEAETVRTAYVSKFRLDNSSNTVIYQIESGYSPYEGTTVKQDMLYWAMQISEHKPKENDNRILCLTKPSQGITLTVGNNTLDLSQYAPYCLDACMCVAYDCLFLYYYAGSGRIDFSDLNGLYTVPKDKNYTGPKPDMTPVDKSDWPKLNVSIPKY